MEITTDVILRGDIWANTLNVLQPSIFETYYDVYIICVAIGIMYDEQILLKTEPNEEFRSVPRTKLMQYTDTLDFLFQTAIITTKNENLSEDERLELAFADKKSEFNKMAFLTKFANFGVMKLHEKISNEPLETMENIKNFLSSSMEGTNFEIDALKDLELALEDENI